VSDELEGVRVLDKRTVLQIVGLSEDTFDRLEARGETPPITRLSERRKGYRLVDVKEWLDARREPHEAAR
jgi:predicted DNA-binding transcriptional regulator AlpA